MIDNTVGKSEVIAYLVRARSNGQSKWGVDYYIIQRLCATAAERASVGTSHKLNGAGVCSKCSIVVEITIHKKSVASANCKIGTSIDCNIVYAGIAGERQSIRGS